MIKVLFICHGNICRSPMAEFIMKSLAAARGLADRLEIASAATSTEEIWNGVGNPVYPPAREELARHGIGCAGKRARQVTREDLEYYDYILCAERVNIRNTERITGPDTEGKIHLMMDYTGRTEDIDDPWYTGDFRGVYNQIEEGCGAFLDYLERSGFLNP